MACKVSEMGMFIIIDLEALERLRGEHSIADTPYRIFIFYFFKIKREKMDCFSLFYSADVTQHGEEFPQCCEEFPQQSEEFPQHG